MDRLLQNHAQRSSGLIPRAGSSGSAFLRIDVKCKSPFSRARLDLPARGRYNIRSTRSERYGHGTEENSRSDCILQRQGARRALSRDRAGKGRVSGQGHLLQGLQQPGSRGLHGARGRALRGGGRKGEPGLCRTVGHELDVSRIGRAALRRAAEDRHPHDLRRRVCLHVPGPHARSRRHICRARRRRDPDGQAGKCHCRRRERTRLPLGLLSG